jgi:hypothetical protein
MRFHAAAEAAVGGMVVVAADFMVAEAVVEAWAAAELAWVAVALA